MTSTTPATWSCPNCLRTVPRRVDVCYCGVRRGQLPDATMAAASGSRSGPLLTLLAAAVGAGVLVASFDRPAPPRSAGAAGPTPGPGRPTAAHAPPEPLPAPPPVLIAVVTPTPTSPVLDRPHEPIADGDPLPRMASAPAPAEPTVDSVAAIREEGTRRFETALGQLAPKIEVLKSKVRTYGEGCVSATSAFMPAGCPTIKTDILQLREEIAAAVAQHEELARRSWVTPGARRELLRRHELDDAALDELIAESDEALGVRR